jgi:hypothetical protein
MVSLEFGDILNSIILAIKYSWEVLPVCIESIKDALVIFVNIKVFTKYLRVDAKTQLTLLDRRLLFLGNLWVLWLLYMVTERHLISVQKVITVDIVHGYRN